MEQQNQLGVYERRVGADRLRVDLGELAVASRLRALVAEEGPRGPELHRLRQLVHAVLEVGAANRGCGLRAQGEPAPALVLEAEHLLLDDVGRLADPAGEELGLLEGGRLDPAVACRLKHLPRGVLDPLPDRLILGEDVEGAAGSLEPLGHRGDLSRRLGYRASSVRKGLVACSAPRVVIPMCPG